MNIKEQLSCNLWKNFRTSLFDFLKEDNLQNLEKKWTNRTHFYKTVMFKWIAKDLKLEHDPEFLRVDYVLTKKAENGWAVPLICIESENYYADTIEKEIRKLCSFNAPLKVLFLCTEWEQVGKKEVDNNDTHWRYILDAFRIESELIGYFAVVVFQWNHDGFKVFEYLYDMNGDRIQKEQVLTLIDTTRTLE